MTTRTSVRTVRFTRPFTLSGIGKEQPAGLYTVETEEALLDTASFVAYRRVLTLIYLKEIPGDTRITGVASINPDELEAALARDNQPRSASDRP